MNKAMKATVVAAGIAMLFGSVNMTEASASKAANKSSQTVIKSSAADKKAVEAAKAVLSKKLAQKNPGDLYILYVRDKALNGGAEFMNYMNMFQFKTYEEYLNQAAKLKGPTLTKPEALPEGYKFVKETSSLHLLSISHSIKKKSRLRLQHKEKAFIIKSLFGRKWAKLI